MSGDLADKIRAYLTAHGWTRGNPGTAGEMWTAPDGRKSAVPRRLSGPNDGDSFEWTVNMAWGVEYRPPAVIAAEILDPDGPEPAYSTAQAWTWTRLEGTDVEILADASVRLCVRRVPTGDGEGQADGT